ncbi:MAG: hypothetical protein ABR591_00805 [Candidatus Velthaea sp.]
MGIQARVTARGIQPIIDALTDAGEDAGPLRTTAWEAAWCRGYDDVAIPAPVLSVSIEGYAIVAQHLAHRRIALIVDAGTELWALIARGPLPQPGARVRLSATCVHDAPWEVKAVHNLGLGLRLRFGLVAPAARLPWVEDLRTSLRGMREVEARNRRTLDARRAALGPLEAVPSLAEELHERERGLRARVEAECAPNADERAAFELGSEKARAKVVAAYATRRRERYDAAMAQLHADVPALSAARDARVAANARLHRALTELETATAASRTIVKRIEILERQLEALEHSGLHAEWNPGERLAAGPVRFEELARTIDVLFGLIPRRARRVLNAS